MPIITLKQERKGKFLIEECQLINVKEVIKIEKSLLRNHHSNT